MNRLLLPRVSRAQVLRFKFNAQWWGMRNNLDAKCKYITGKICRERLKGNDGACPFRPVNSL